MTVTRSGVREAIIESRKTFKSKEALDKHFNNLSNLDEFTQRALNLIDALTGNAAESKADGNQKEQTIKQSYEFEAFFNGTFRYVESNKLVVLERPVLEGLAYNSPQNLARIVARLAEINNQTLNTKFLNLLLDAIAKDKNLWHKIVGEISNHESDGLLLMVANTNNLALFQRFFAQWLKAESEGRYFHRHLSQNPGQLAAIFAAVKKTNNPNFISGFENLWENVVRQDTRLPKSLLAWDAESITKQLDGMIEYSKQSKVDPKKSQVSQDLANELKNNVENFNTTHQGKPNKLDCAIFKLNQITKIHSKDPELKNHRHHLPGCPTIGLKEFFLNLFLGVVTAGLGLLSGFFRVKSESQKKVNQLHNTLMNGPGR